MNGRLDPQRCVGSIGWSVIALLALFGMVGPGAHAQPAAEPSLTVAVSPNAPWAMFDASLPPGARRPEGFTIDLWQALAADLAVGTTWLYVERSAEVFLAVHDGAADVGLVGFPAGTLELGRQALVLAEQPVLTLLWRGLRTALERLSPTMFLYPLAILAFAAHVRWLIDRLGPAEGRLFPAGYLAGVGAGLWWVIGLLIDFGKSDAHTGMARGFDLLWHLLGLALLSGFVGVLTASLTLSSVARQVDRLDDLHGKPVAVVDTGEHARPLPELGQRVEEVVSVASVEAGLERMLAGEVAAVIGPSALIQRYAAVVNAEGRLQVDVLPERLSPQRYAVVVRPDHPRSSDIDQLLAQVGLPRGLEPSLANRLSAKWGIEVR